MRMTVREMQGARDIEIQKENWAKTIIVKSFKFKTMYAHFGKCVVTPIIVLDFNNTC